MHRQRLVVLSGNDEDGPVRLDPLEAFGFATEAEWKAWLAQTQETESVNQAPDRVCDPPKPSQTGLRMMTVLMERPFFALAARRAKPIAYKSADGSIYVNVKAGPAGVATIFDSDVVMFLIDRLAETPVSAGNSIRMKAADYFRAVGAKSGGDQYRLFGQALERLHGTVVATNAGPDGKAGAPVTFTWIEAVSCHGREWNVTVPAWLAKGARSKFLLKIAPAYFELRGGLSRGLYLIACKHVGNPGIQFKIKPETLQAKLGSGDTDSHFRHRLKSFVAENSLPDFHLSWADGPKGMVTMRRRARGYG